MPELRTIGYPPSCSRGHRTFGGSTPSMFCIRFRITARERTRHEHSRLPFFSYLADYVITRRETGGRGCCRRERRGGTRGVGSLALGLSEATASGGSDCAIRQPGAYAG